MPESSRTISFVELRGGTPEKRRDDGDKPRTAVSYCAQYGIPLEDCEQALQEFETHSDMLGWAEKTIRQNKKLRQGALEHKTRPLSDDEDPVLKKYHEGTLTDPEFTRPATIVGVGGVEAQRNFFACEEYSDEELDEFAEFMAKCPGGDWLDKMPKDTRRIYAMSCIDLQRKDPDKFQELYVNGKAWEDYG